MGNKGLVIGDRRSTLTPGRSPVFVAEVSARYVKVGYYETKMSTDTVQYRIFKSAYSIWKEIDGDYLVRYIEFLKKNK